MLGIPVSIGNHAMTFEELREEAQLAEELGFQGWLLSEHHQRRGLYRYGSGLLALAALSVVTYRIRLGTCVLLLPLHHPVELAEETAVLDQLSSGRLVLGVGMGYTAEDFASRGLDRRRRAAVFREGLDVLRMAWTEPVLNFQGDTFRFHDVRVEPKPFQQPHPALWVAAWSEPGVRRAATSGDAWVTDPLHSLEAVAGLAHAYRVEAQAAGRTGRIVLARYVLLGDSLTVSRDIAPLAVTAFRTYWKTGGFNPEVDASFAKIAAAEEIGFETFVRSRVASGSPEQCVEWLSQACEAVGADELVVTFLESAEHSHPYRMEAMRRLAHAAAIGCS